MKGKIVVDIIAFLFIFLFVYAAGSKLLDVQKFRVQVGQSPLLTDLAGFVAWFIPVLELAVAGLLATSRFRLVGLLGSFGLMVLFTTYIISVLQLSDSIPCACGGVLNSLGWHEHLIFNICFVLLAATGIAFCRRQDFSNVPS